MLTPGGGPRRASTRGLTYRRQVLTAATLTGRIRIDVGPDDPPVSMPPGACSNPEPPESIRDFPLETLDIAWYRLAMVELAADQAVGIDDSLAVRLEGRSIPFMEIGL